MHPVADIYGRHETLGFMQKYPDTEFFRSRKTKNGIPYSKLRHKGIDCAKAKVWDGTKWVKDSRPCFIQVPVNGILIYSGKNGGFGNMVAIGFREDGFNRLFILAHLAMIQKRFRRRGIEVKKGEILGLMGETGTCTDEHTHVQVEEETEDGRMLHWWMPGKKFRVISPRPYLT